MCMHICVGWEAGGQSAAGGRQQRAGDSPTGWRHMKAYIDPFRFPGYSVLGLCMIGGKMPSTVLEQLKVVDASPNCSLRGCVVHIK